jgi:hypothetical protein
VRITVLIMSEGQLNEFKVSEDEHMHEDRASGEEEEEGASQRPRREELMLTDLPEACICLIASYLRPKDVARGACVSQGFRNTLDSDSVWDQFVHKSANEVVYLNQELKAATKKKVFMFLCKPVLLRDNLAFWLDQDTGGVCYSVSAKGLRIVWGDDDRYWEWAARPGARWPEVACLREVCWFHTSGEIACKLPAGVYTLSWRLQYEAGSGVRGWDRVPAEFTLATTDESQRTASHRYLSNWPNNAHQQNELTDLTPVRLVEDNWFEFDAGEITVSDEEKPTSVQFSMVETESGNWKSGIFLDGVVLRPSSITKTTGRYLSVEEIGESSLQNEEPTQPLGLLGSRGRPFPRRRGGIRVVHPNPPPSFDAGEQ